MDWKGSFLQLSLFNMRGIKISVTRFTNVVN